MSDEHYSKDARRHITECCLIATDIDKTILTQVKKGEREQFMRNMAPPLLHAATLGTRLAFITGNSMKQLCSRFLSWLIEYLCFTGQLNQLDKCHFFCNSGGVYAHFNSRDIYVENPSSDPMDLKKLILEKLLYIEGDELCIKPDFINLPYLKQTLIPDSELAVMKGILEKQCGDYISLVKPQWTNLKKRYEIDKFQEDKKTIWPSLDDRMIKYGQPPCSGTVQLTLKPILNNGLSLKKPHGKDFREKMVKSIRSSFADEGLGHYSVRSAGSTSIDITLSKLDKGFALQWLINHLNLYGQETKGQKFGSNAIYFGDEVSIGGGNDFSVTKLPGLQVFAVNYDQQSIPFLAGVFVPSAILVGPDATAEILMRYSRLARQLLAEYDQRGFKKIPTAIEMLKESLFLGRIQDKIGSLKLGENSSVDDLQTLHAFVTMFGRNDRMAKEWLAMLVDGLDAIMAQLAKYTALSQPALGTSYDEGDSN